MKGIIIMQNQLPKGKEHEKTLGLFDLSILGIGAIIGTVAAERQSSPAEGEFYKNNPARE